MKRFQFLVFTILLFTAHQLIGQKICPSSSSTYSSNNCYSYSNNNYSGYSGSSTNEPYYDYVNFNLNYSANLNYLSKSILVNTSPLIMHAFGTAFEFRNKNKIGWGLEYNMGFMQNTPTYTFRPGMHASQLTADGEWAGRINSFQMRRLGLVSTKVIVFHVVGKKENNKYQNRIFAEIEMGAHRMKTKVEQGAFNSFKHIGEKVNSFYAGFNLGYRIKMLRTFVGVGSTTITESKPILLFQAGVGVNLDFLLRSKKSSTLDTQTIRSSSSSFNLPKPNLLKSQIRKVEPCKKIKK